jgi:hypothetical protein
MRRILSLLAILTAGLIVSLSAHAQSAYPANPPIGVTKTVGDSLTLSWDAPTLHADGTPITVALTYNLYGASPGGVFSLKQAGIAGTSNTRANLAAGTPCYYVTAVDGTLESDPSAIFCVNVVAAPSKPAAPTNFTGK